MIKDNTSVNIGDYIEDGYMAHHTFIPDQAYGEALDSLVLACVDIFVLYDGQVLIGKRARQPQADWWLFGGRMRTGERLGESAHRLLKVEAGIDISSDRFEYLTTFASAWKLRAHAPQENGTHTVSTVLYVTLSKEEFEQVTLNDEYDDQQLVSVDELLDDTRYHPVLGQCARAFRASTQK